MKLTEPSTTGTQNDAEPFFRWDSSYKVTVLAKSGRRLDLPGEKTHIGSEQALENEDTLVCGEAGGGHSNFLRWWRWGLDGGARDWILVDASVWDRRFFRRRSGDDRSSESDAQDQAGEAIEKLGLEQGVINRTQALRRWSEKLKRPFTLIICNLMSLGAGPALEVATTLRRLRDPLPVPESAGGRLEPLGIQRRRSDRPVGLPVSMRGIPAPESGCGGRGKSRGCTAERPRLLPAQP